MIEPNVREKLIVALDVQGAAEAARLVDVLGASVTFYKIGLELVMNGGLELARSLKTSGRRVFLDMKLLDIPNTVESAVANVARMGVDFLTIHAQDSKTVRSAIAGRGTSRLKLLGVTVLTSVDRTDLDEQGARGIEPGALVAHRAKLMAAAGGDGVIASGLEAAALRRAMPRDFLIVTPGIRPAGSAAGDQARVATPTSAIRDGADYLVVGRPVTQAADPKAAAEAIVEEIAGALRR